MAQLDHTRTDGGIRARRLSARASSDCAVARCLRPRTSTTTIDHHATKYAYDRQRHQHHTTGCGAAGGLAPPSPAIEPSSLISHLSLSRRELPLAAAPLTLKLDSMLLDPIRLTRPPVPPPESAAPSSSLSLSSVICVTTEPVARPALSAGAVGFGRGLRPSTSSLPSAAAA